MKINKYKKIDIDILMYIDALSAIRYGRVDRPVM